MSTELLSLAKPYQFVTTAITVYDQHLQFDRHFYNLGQNKIRPRVLSASLWTLSTT